jgi:UDP-N-acetylmuramoylalanine-D-glutamate ligase
MEIVRSINHFEYMCDALADASACASAISKIKDNFILITYEEVNFSELINALKPRCKALFYIGKPDADILYKMRSHIPLIVQTENIEEAIMLASQFKIEGLNKIIFLPCFNKSNDLTKEEMIEVFKKTVKAIV